MNRHPVRFVLVETSHPGNIGACARAMKTMGYDELVLVNPSELPSGEARAMASGAQDVLAAARVTTSLAEAVEDCGLVIGASARHRRIGCPELAPRECAQQLQRARRGGAVALVFGPERSGLSNEALDLCNALVYIPANPAYSSLNLAMAVQLLAWELRQQEPFTATSPEPDAPLAALREMELFYEHLERVLLQSGFLNPANPRQLMRRLRRLFNRSQLDQNELNILRGILSALAPGSGARPSRPLPGPLRSVEATPPAIYLDYAASTPLLEEVRETMLECLGADGPHANPSPTSHGPAKAAWAIVERAQADVAALLGAGPEEIVFTSGATEANNLAIIGAARQRSHRGRHLVTALTEHAAVLEPFRHLERNGFTVTWLSPDAQGRIDPATLEAALRPDTTLVSLMHVNNETGVINDLGSLGALCRDRDIWFHCDAAQGLDHLALDLSRVPIDLLSLSAHKFYGPKGVGALYLRRERIRRVEPLLFGGGQQRSLRPGSLPAHQLAGLGAAARLAAVSREPRARHLEALRDRLWAQLRGLPDTWLNGEGAPRAGHILNVSVAGVHGESLHRALQPLAVSAGSSCAAGRGEPSHVLRCLGRSQALAESSVRFSFGLPTGDEEVDRAALLFRETVTRLRRLAGPLAV